MSASATDSSKDGMDCDRVAREEILEAYLAGGLSEEDRDRLRERIREALPVRADGGIALQARAWAVRGRAG